MIARIAGSWSPLPSRAVEDYARDAAFYGRLSRVAIDFYLSTGNPAELRAVFVYARDAARAAARVLAS